MEPVEEAQPQPIVKRSLESTAQSRDTYLALEEDGTHPPYLHPSRNAKRLLLTLLRMKEEPCHLSRLVKRRVQRNMSRPQKDPRRWVAIHRSLRTSTARISLHCPIFPASASWSAHKLTHCYSQKKSPTLTTNELREKLLKEKVMALRRSSSNA